MTIIDEIRSFFSSLSQGAALLNTLPCDYPAFVVRLGAKYGVAIEWEVDRPISEYFSNAHLFSTEILVDGEEKVLLMLVSDREEYRNEFAAVCAQFVDPGEEGHDRAALLDNPLEWWSNWKNLLGNTSLDRAPYTILCELLTLEYVLTFDPEAKWTAAESGTHDIESETGCYEVKSTKLRYGSYFTVSSQHQLLSPKPLTLYFIRVEPSPAGLSINDAVDDLISIGYSPVLLERQLSKQRYEKGSSDREKRFSILEKREYKVDDAFPKITAESFKGDVIPAAIFSITYVVDLDGIPYNSW